jgi:hypothetical protein
MTSLPIELPEGFVSLVTQGSSVATGQVIAQKEAPKDEIVNILQGLNISRRQAKKTLKKGPGDTIHPGDIVAVKKNFFGKVQTSIVSQITGEILRYERDTGDLVVRTIIEPSALEIISPVAGTITLCNNREIVIETKDAIVSGGVALGINGEGTLFILQESFGEEESTADNALYYLDGRAEGKIVLVKTLTRDLLIKGDSIGASGFLSIEISDEDITYVREKDIQLPVLGVTEELVSRIHSWENKKVLIDIASKAIILRE